MPHIPRAVEFPLYIQLLSNFQPLFSAGTSPDVVSWHGSVWNE